MGILGKLRDQYQTHGARKFIIWLTKQALKNLHTYLCDYQIIYVIERALDDRMPDVHSKIPTQFVYGSVSDLMRFRYIRKPWRHYRKILEDRFQRGQTCILAFHENMLIGYVWITDRPETDRNLGITINPAEGESYGFDLYVLPEYRKDFVGIELISRWLRDARDAGKTKAIGVVASNNRPMLMTTRLVFGFRRKREVRSMEFFKRWGHVIGETELS
jgi:GNAT superfamily N-acetyltransferase